MRTQIFAYKGVFGTLTDLDNGVFINSPKSPGQLGCVVPVEEVDITPEAVEMIKKCQREKGSFAGLMLTRHSPEAAESSKASIGILGFGPGATYEVNLRIGRDCDLSILEMCNVTNFKMPEEFMNMVDSIDA